MHRLLHLPARDRPPPAAVWFAAGALVLLLDALSGPYLLFPILFVVPVCLAAWYNGPATGVALGAALPLARLVIAHEWDAPAPLWAAVANTAIRVVVLTLLAALVGALAERTRRLDAEVRQLRALLSVCSHCRRVRGDDGAWETLERYVAAHSRTRFSHGLCPDCVRAHYPDEAEDLLGDDRPA